MGRKLLPMRVVAALLEMINALPSPALISRATSRSRRDSSPSGYSALDSPARCTTPSFSAAA